MSPHILSASAMLVGVCLTVIGVVNIMVAQTGIETFADDMLALDALLFTVSSVLSYAALRARGMGRTRRLYRVSEVLFVIGLTMMVIVCGVIVYGLV